MQKSDTGIHLLFYLPGILFVVVFYLRDTRTPTLRAISVIVVGLMTPSHGKVVKILLEFGADSNAIDCHGVRPDDVIRKGGLGDVDLSQKRELVDILICHRAKIRGCNGEWGVPCDWWT